MDKLRKEIKRVSRHNLSYYESHLNLIDSYIEEKPDISIESCKALIEGISKLALHLLAQEPISSSNGDLSELFKRALNKLQEGKGFVDVDIARRLSGIVHYLGQLRNSNGDISHGRASLKDQLNDADFAEFISEVTESLSVYLLRRLDQQAEKEIIYEENEEFNFYLDEQTPLTGQVLYSRALYDQERETYETLLGDYELEFNEE